MVAIAAVVAIQLFSGSEIDRTYRERDQRVVENGVLTYEETLTEKTFAQAYWDDAVVNLDNRFSEDWAREYVGIFFWRTEHFDLISTLDRNDNLTFAMSDGHVVDFAALEPLREAAAPLIAMIRQGERERGPLPLLIDLDPAVQQGRDQPPSAEAHSVSAEAKQRREDSGASTDGKLDLKPIAASGLARIGNSIYVVTATLVQPDNTVLPLTSRSAIILLGKKLDKDIVAKFGSGYLLEDAHLDQTPHGRAAGWAQADLMGVDGQRIATFEWRAGHPGSELVRKTAPALTLFALLLALSVAVVFRKGRQITLDLTNSEARASYLAFNDELTALPNRAALEAGYADIRARQQARHEPLAVLCIDIDRFKTVNDSYGHPAGDALLSQVAARLNEMCERHHVLGRFGGDEFMLLCPSPNAADAARIGQMVVTLLATPFDIGPGRVFVGGSVGIVMVDPDSEVDAPEAFRRADLAMYRAKELGRGQFAFYESSPDETVRARSEVQNALRDALEAGGLDVHYQPQVDEHGTLIGAEALVRWPDAASKGVTTAAFVQLAEETGLIDRLGNGVMAQVFRDAAQWPGIPTAVNLSAVQLRAADFNERIESLMDEAGADPRQFEFEITEGMLLDQNEETIARLERLRATGSRISLDDFGTGYSGLSYLHQYPIDAVKIDMSFTGMLGKEPRAKALVETIVRLAAALELEVIAEGVETETQRQLLLEAGCRRFQGYLMGKPMPAEELAETFLAPATI